MARTHTLKQVAVVLLFALIGRAIPAWSQEPAAPAAPAAPAVDSNLLWVGDWDYTAQLRDSTIEGVWRINFANGRFTGMVMIPHQPPSPITGMTVRDHFRTFSMTAFFNTESYMFSGHLDNPRTVTGTLTIRGGIGRVRATKRG